MSKIVILIIVIVIGSVLVGLLIKQNQTATSMFDHMVKNFLTRTDQPPEQTGGEYYRGHWRNTKNPRELIKITNPVLHDNQGPDEHIQIWQLDEDYYPITSVMGRYYLPNDLNNISITLPGGLQGYGQFYNHSTNLTFKMYTKDYETGQETILSTWSKM